MDHVYKIPRRDKLLILVLILAFFGPYFPGTPLRLDQLLGWSYIFILIAESATNRRLQFASVPDKRVVWLVSTIALFTLIRLFIDVEDYRFAFQVANQFSYFFAGAAIFTLHHALLIRSKTYVITTLVLVSIVVNLFAVLQVIDPTNDLVRFSLYWYGGTGSQQLEYEGFNTMAALTLLGGGQAVSIFGGMQGLAVFDLFVVALGIGMTNDSALSRRAKFLGIIGLFLGLVGGLFSGSKTFIFGSFIFWATLIFIGVPTKRKICYMLAFLILFLSIFYYFASGFRVVGDRWNLIVEGNLWRIFETRFGTPYGEGYLSHVMAKTYEFYTLFLGLGSFASLYKYTDFEFRQVILVGGLPLFVLYYGFLLYLLVFNWRSKRSSPYGLPLFGLGVAYLFTCIGMDTHLQARVMPLWTITNLLLGLDRNTAMRAAPRRLAQAVPPSAWRGVGLNRATRHKPSEALL